MVCIPCIVVPVLLWVYKKFLEPYIYPYIAPIINRVWPKKAPPVTCSQSKLTPEKSNGDCQLLANGTANGIVATGPEEASDKNISQPVANGMANGIVATGPEEASDKNISQPLANGPANGIVATGPEEASDKKRD